jgi:hypothetical protein
MKTISPMCNEKEWTMHVGVVMKSEIYGMELVVRMVGWNNVGDESSRSPTLPKVVDEHESQCDTNADEPSPFIGSNETVLNVKPVSGSVGDVVADVGMILGVDPQLIIVVAPTGDVPSVVPEFMAEYDATFGDKWAEDSVDDQFQS